MTDRWENWTSHDYPVGVAFEERCPDKYCAWLLDMPGVAAQAPTIGEALARLDNIVPQVLDVLKREGVDAPYPSAPHGFSCREMEWLHD